MNLLLMEALGGGEYRSYMGSVYSRFAIDHWSD